MTPHDRVTLKNRDVWQQATAAVKAQFCFAGPLLYRGIPDAIRRHLRIHA